MEVLLKVFPVFLLVILIGLCCLFDELTKCSPEEIDPNDILMDAHIDLKRKKTQIEYLKKELSQANNELQTLRVELNKDTNNRPIHLKIGAVYPMQVNYGYNGRLDFEVVLDNLEMLPVEQNWMGPVELPTITTQWKVIKKSPSKEQCIHDFETDGCFRCSKCGISARQYEVDKWRLKHES